MPILGNMKARAADVRDRARHRERLSHLRKTVPEAVDAVLGVRRLSLTYLSMPALLDLAEAVGEIESSRIPGLMLEAGCARGGSAAVIASAKAPTRPLRLYDVFGTIPPPGDRDGADAHERYAEIAAGRAQGPRGSTYYGYEPGLIDAVRSTLADLGVQADSQQVTFFPGFYEDSLTIEEGERVAFAHIDCDWYDSVTTCLVRISPHLAIGGRLVIDDYFAYSGCRDAVDDHFRNRKRDFEFEMKARLHIRRVA